jgi:hypothetical protein
MPPRIDDSHQPYKRKRSLGPGPRKRPRVLEMKNWECRKLKATPKYYVQVCRDLETGRTRKIKTKKKWKRKYNKLYRAWSKRHPIAAKSPQPTYRCRRQPGVQCR